MKAAWEVTTQYSDLEDLLAHPSVKQAMKAAVGAGTLAEPVVLPPSVQQPGTGGADHAAHCEQVAEAVGKLARALQASSVPRAALEPLFGMLELAEHEHAVTLEPADKPAATEEDACNEASGWMDGF